MKLKTKNDVRPTVRVPFFGIVKNNEMSEKVFISSWRGLVKSYRNVIYLLNAPFALNFRRLIP